MSAENNNPKSAKDEKKRKKDDFVDDGRTIADMSVDGVPSSLPTRLSGQKRPKLPPIDEFGRPMPLENTTIELSKDEKKAIRRGVTKAFLLYGLIGIIAMILVFVLLVFIWMR